MHHLGSHRSFEHRLFRDVMPHSTVDSYQHFQDNLPRSHPEDGSEVRMELLHTILVKPFTHLCKINYKFHNINFQL